MPNWIEGTLKIRGPKENVLRFFEEGIGHCSVNSECPIDELYKIDQGDEEDSFIYVSIFKIVWVKDTKRAFLEPQDFSIYLDIYSDDQAYACANVRQAWGFDTEDWAEISKKYGVDIRLYGIEGGMQFGQIIEFHNGETILNQGMEFNDYYWECPFPFMGG